jgi:bacteriocin-like protein
LEKLKEMSDEELKEIKGVGPKAVEEIRNLLK